MLIFWSIIRYRRRDGGQAAQFKNNMSLEITYTAIPVIIVTALFIIAMNS